MLYWTKEGGLALVSSQSCDEKSTKNGGFHLYLDRYSNQGWLYFPDRSGCASWRKNGKADIPHWDLATRPAELERIVFPSPERLKSSLELSRLLPCIANEDLFI